MYNIYYRLCSSSESICYFNFKSHNRLFGVLHSSRDFGNNSTNFELYWFLLFTKMHLQESPQAIYAVTRYRHTPELICLISNQSQSYQSIVSMNPTLNRNTNLGVKWNDNSNCHMLSLSVLTWILSTATMNRNYDTLVHPARRIYSSCWSICMRIAREITARRSTFVIASVRQRLFLPIYDFWVKYERNDDMAGTLRHSHTHAHIRKHTDTDRDTHLYVYQASIVYCWQSRAQWKKTGETQALTIS